MVIVTPLMEFVRQKRVAKSGSQVFLVFLSIYTLYMPIGGIMFYFLFRGSLAISCICWLMYSAASLLCHLISLILMFVVLFFRLNIYEQAASKCYISTKGISVVI